MTTRQAWPWCATFTVDVLEPPDAFVEAPRALVVAGDALARRALVTALRARFDGATVTSAASLDDTGADAHDVILWDVGARDEAVGERLGVTVLPEVPVVALVATAESARPCLAWGARAVLPRDADDDTVAAALRATLRGLVVVAPPLVEALLARDTGERSADVATTGASLTAREREVLALVADGLSNKLVAHRLGISEHTVKFHVTAVMTRLGAQTRTEAVVLAARRGLLAL